MWRLSDGHRWLVPPLVDPAGDGSQRARALGISCIDGEELIYSALGNTQNTDLFVRQRLDALGPGEPAP